MQLQELEWGVVLVAGQPRFTALQCLLPRLLALPVLAAELDEATLQTFHGDLQIAFLLETRAQRFQMPQSLLALRIVRVGGAPQLLVALVDLDDLQVAVALLQRFLEHTIDGYHIVQEAECFVEAPACARALALHSQSLALTLPPIVLDIVRELAMQHLPTEASSRCSSGYSSSCRSSANCIQLSRNAVPGLAAQLPCMIVQMIGIPEIGMLAIEFDELVRQLHAEPHAQLQRRRVGALFGGGFCQLLARIVGLEHRSSQARHAQLLQRLIHWLHLLH